ncbi:MAG: hypothetical protein BGN88_09820 [Clostridiales bacterium 43-6]|nr:MAG: hypothetical protein BGN88_09820 [Clostridiales bacterium 43-6]
MNGRLLRLAKICPPLKKICIVAMDHGITNGPILGIEDYVNAIRLINQAKPNAIILHKGLLMKISNFPELASGNYIMHLSASTLLNKNSHLKVLVASVEEAIKLGALGVSIHINFGVESDCAMLEDLGLVSRACSEWGIPLLAMVYNHISNDEIDHIIHSARIAEELGADIIKIPHPGTQEKVKQIIDKIHIPVIIAGGETQNDFNIFLKMVKESIEVGAKGIAVGRNIFQNPDPTLATSQIIRVLNDD